MRIRIETPVLSLGVVMLTGIRIPEDYEPLPEPVPEDDIQVVRRLYRAIGQDPTRNRPSSEALVRRIRKGLGLPRINALVDAINHCSATLVRPFGAYDPEKLTGDLVLRIGREGEGYEGHGRWVNLAGRFAFFDEKGPFGNPTMDSLRTRLTESATRALVTVFAPADDPHPRLPWVAETLTGVVGGVAEIRIVRPEGVDPEHRG